MIIEKAFLLNLCFKLLLFFFSCRFVTSFLLITIINSLLYVTSAT